MAKENAILNDEEILNEKFTESFDFDELEEKLQSQLEEELADMQFLAEEKEKIGSPDNLGNVIMDVVWEQFLNQVAVTAGEDFIKENRGLHLDLRKEAHIQTTENFAEGKIATHNTEIDYQQRYDDWQSNFVKDENGNVVTHQTRSGKEEVTLVKGARKPFDDERKKRGLVGNAEKGTDMDETVSVAEIIRDPSANAHMTQEERIEFDLSEKNLNEMDSSWNRSKGDTPTNEWLGNTNSKGQNPQEIFDNMTDEDVEKLRQKDAEAREEFEKKKKEAEQKSIEAGKKSRKEEAFRIGGKALRVVLMQLLAELVREIIAKLVKWFKSSKKALDTLLDSLKEAIHSFIGKMKQHLINAGNTLFTTVATAIIGPIVGTIKRVWIMLKQGWSSLKNAIAYIKDPANKGKPIGRLLMEVGKIVIAGMTGIGAMLLGEVIEKGLMTIPVFAVEIPLLGSLANILGIFLGAVVAGIIGAIAINIIEKQIEKSMKRENLDAQINKGNEILKTQHQIQIVNEVLLDRDKENAQANISGRHQEAASIMKNAYRNIMEDFVEDFSQSGSTSVIDEEDMIINIKIDKVSNDLDDLLADLN
ncbi:MAG: hypothetical protein ACI4DX_05740 [Oliverpabstia sp.]